MQKISLITRLKHGSVARLYLPILLVIIFVTLLRYHLLIEAEVKAAQTQSEAQLLHIRHYVLPMLIQQGGTDQLDLVQNTLDSAARFNDHLVALNWRQGQDRVGYSVPDTMADHVPEWFAKLAEIRDIEQVWPVQLADGRAAGLTVRIGRGRALAQAWHTVGVQLPVTALNIVTIFTLLTLLLRANTRMLKRLAEATANFRAGRLDTRMVMRGTLEARAVARTFNLMATEIQRLVKSLQETQKRQDEQIHFTRQLIDALPLPVFVRTENGTCLSVNKAWEDFFATPAARVVGRVLPSDFTPLDDGSAAPSDVQTQRRGSEVKVKASSFVQREMAYFRAPFSSTDGAGGGTISALVDITERKLAQEELLAQKELAEVTLSSIGDGVITTNTAGQIESINEMAQKLTGFSAGQALGQSLTEVFRLDENAKSVMYGTALKNLHRVESPLHGFQQILVHRSGERYPIEFTAAPIRKARGLAVGCVLVFRDVSEKRDLQQRISWQTKHDVLTGLKNRVSLSERLTHAIFQARQEEKLLGVCLIDLDRFQDINDRLGSVCGDRLLREVALRLLGCAEDRNNVARLGGDEFVILLGGHRSVAAIRGHAQELLRRLAQPYALDDQEISLTASAGIAIFPLDDANPDTLMRHADQAMCHAKQTGRNGLHVFDAERDLNIQTQHSRVSRIAAGLRAGEMRLFFQPKVNLRTGEIQGFEALMRWQHPQRGLVSPGEFLPLIEHTDLIVEAGNWALHEAMAQLESWRVQGRDWTVSVNIAAWHFHRADFVDGMRALLAAYPQVPPERLELEILESAALQDIGHMRSVMQACQALGVRFALDDFGTGFSSLSYLKQLPAETIKIDRCFVDGLLDGGDDRTLVSAIVGLSQAFSRGVIAEGVENPEQARQLLSLGCEWGQGYGIARPMPVALLDSWAEQHGRAYQAA